MGQRSMRIRLQRRPRNAESRMSVLDHLRELRRRLIIIAIIIVLGAVLGWILYNPILQFLERPYCAVNYKKRFPGTDVAGCKLIYTGVLDGFTTRLKVSVIAGAVLTGPLWLYQVWAFITPGLKKKERKYTIVFIGASSALFVSGMTLAFLVLSRGLNVLINTAGSGTLAVLTANGYLSFVTLLLLVFGAAFELPLLVVMANFAGVLSARLLRKSQRISIFLIFLFAAVATPSTDPFTMCAMAVPMCILFEGAVVIAIAHDRRKIRRHALALVDDANAGDGNTVLQEIS
jgi:sec-independent protein translocase protein TatC